MEVTQVGLERLVLCDRQDVDQAQEVLLVVVFQVRVVVLNGQVFGDFVVAACELEVVRTFVTTGQGHVSVVTGSTTGSLGQLTGGQCQTVEFLVSDDATLEGLRQQTTVVRYEDRQVRLQSVTDFQLGLRDFDLGVGPSASPVSHRRTVGSCRGNGVRSTAVSGTVVDTAAQVDAVHALNVEAEPNSTRGVTRDKVEQETLSGLTLVLPFGASRRRLARITFEIQSTGTECRFAVIQETSCTGLSSQDTCVYGQGQGGLLHCVSLLMNLIFVVPGLEPKAQNRGCAISAGPDSASQWPQD